MLSQRLCSSRKVNDHGLQLSSHTARAANRLQLCTLTANTCSLSQNITEAFIFTIQTNLRLQCLYNLQSTTYTSALLPSSQLHFTVRYAVSGHLQCGPPSCNTIGPHETRLSLPSASNQPTPARLPLLPRAVSKPNTTSLPIS